MKLRGTTNTSAQKMKKCSFMGNYRLGTLPVTSGLLD